MKVRELLEYYIGTEIKLIDKDGDIIMFTKSQFEDGEFDFISGEKVRGFYSTKIALIVII